MQRGRAGREDGREREGKERERLKNQSPSHQQLASGHQVEKAMIYRSGPVNKADGNPRKPPAASFAEKISTQAWGFQ